MSFRGSLEPGQHPQQGGLAGTGPTQQGEDLALVDVETLSTASVRRTAWLPCLIWPTSTSLRCWLPSGRTLVGTGGYRHCQTPKGDSRPGPSINTIWRPGWAPRLGSGFDLGPAPGDQALHRAGMCFLHIQTLKHRLGGKLTRPRERPCP